MRRIVRNGCCGCVEGSDGVVGWNVAPGRRRDGENLPEWSGRGAVAGFFAMLACVVSGWVPSAQAGASELSAGRRIYMGETPVYKGQFGCTAPTVADWNNDGKIDLVLGLMEWGRIGLLTNSSSGGLPVFADMTFVEAGGSPIEMNWG